ncbi:Uncharacterized protein TCM_033589 [Theobroma cacao]|uniref:Uncharacterized protein n=1 Tax=Theobroma cacao TaxID=3641 RepID=A0A061FC45_THECC|nr:Uncharacterized protein TCM_033589 [Theobroma cacao]
MMVRLLTMSRVGIFEMLRLLVFGYNSLYTVQNREIHHIDVFSDQRVFPLRVGRGLGGSRLEVLNAGSDRGAIVTDKETLHTQATNGKWC